MTSAPTYAAAPGSRWTAASCGAAASAGGSAIAATASGDGRLRLFRSSHRFRLHVQGQVTRAQCAVLQELRRERRGAHRTRVDPGKQVQHGRIAGNHPGHDLRRSHAAFPQQLLDQRPQGSCHHGMLHPLDHLRVRDAHLDPSQHVVPQTDLAVEPRGGVSDLAVGQVDQDGHHGRRPHVHGDAEWGVGAAVPGCTSQWSPACSRTSGSFAAGGGRSPARSPAARTGRS